ncbi:MAG: helix-turn-helix domain-containing protein [Terracidiphilus sp.]
MNVEKQHEDFNFASWRVTLNSRGNSQPFVAAVTLFGALIAGTGGLYTPANTALVPKWTNVPAIKITSTPSVERKMPAKEVSIPRAIVQIRDRLGLKMSELADICGVSRQAVYLWLRGGNITNEYAQRIWQLSPIAERLQLAGVDRPEHFIHRPLSPEGDSLFQLLVSGANVDSALALLKEQFNVEQDSRHKANAERQNTRHRRQDFSSVTELTTPILEESDG